MDDKDRNVARAFPKTCNACHRVYETETEYNTRTERCGPSSEQSSFGLILFLRNCLCGSTLGLTLEDNLGDFTHLMGYFRDKAQEHEKKFQKMLRSPKFRGQRTLQELCEKDDLWKYIGEHIIGDTKVPYDRVCLQVDKNLPESVEIIERKELYGPKLKTLRINASNKRSMNGSTFWTQVALDKFREDYNAWVDENEIHLPKQRILVVDTEEQNNALLKNLQIPDTRIVYTTDIKKARKLFRENPEYTSAVVVEVPYTSEEQEEFIRWIRDNDGDNGKIRGYTRGKEIPILGINGSDNKKRLAVNEMLAKPYNIASFRETLKKYCDIGEQDDTA